MHYIYRRSPSRWGAQMLTTYLDNLQHASATVQIAHCLLGSLFVGLGPFVPVFIAQHVTAVRAAC
ncbi:MAG: hypothetical protein MIL41_22685 [Hyphomicrobiales bacterium]|jgi:hypothetical protein